MRRTLDVPSPQEKQRRTKIADLQKQLEADPTNERLLQTLGNLYLADGQASSAAAAYLKAAERYRQNGHVLKAVALYRQLTDMFPDSLTVQEGMAKLLENADRRAEAAQAYRKAAHLSEREGQSEQAQQFQAKAFQLAPPAKSIDAKEAKIAEPAPLLSDPYAFDDTEETKAVKINVSPSSSDELERPDEISPALGETLLPNPSVTTEKKLMPRADTQGREATQILPMHQLPSTNPDLHQWTLHVREEFGDEAFERPWTREHIFSSHETGPQERPESSP